MSEAGFKARSGDVFGAELAQMFGHKLSIKQGEAASDQPGSEMNERDFARITLARDHAFAEEGRPQNDAIKPADELFAVPAFNRMGMALFVQDIIGIDDRAIDPSRRACRAKMDHLIKVAVDPDFKRIAADRALQFFGDMKMIERQNRARFRLDEIDFMAEAILRHRKRAARESLQDEVSYVARWLRGIARGMMHERQACALR